MANRVEFLMPDQATPTEASGSINNRRPKSDSVSDAFAGDFHLSEQPLSKRVFVVGEDDAVDGRELEFDESGNQWDPILPLTSVFDAKHSKPPGTATIAAPLVSQEPVK